MDVFETIKLDEKIIRSFIIWTVMILAALIGGAVFIISYHNKAAANPDVKHLPRLSYEAIDKMPEDEDIIAEVKDGTATILLAVSPWIEAYGVDEVEYNDDKSLVTVYLKPYIYGDTDTPAYLKAPENPTQRATAIENGQDLYRKYTISVDKSVKDIKVVKKEPAGQGR